jgi:hypothetical protein
MGKIFVLCSGVPHACVWSGYREASHATDKPCPCMDCPGHGRTCGQPVVDPLDDGVATDGCTTLGFSS